MKPETKPDVASNRRQLVLEYARKTANHLKLTPSNIEHWVSAVLH